MTTYNEIKAEVLALLRYRVKVVEVDTGLKRKDLEIVYPRLRALTGSMALLIREQDRQLQVMREALEPLAKIADVVKSTDERIGLWSEQSNLREPVRLLLGHAIAAKKALAETMDKEIGL